MATGRFSNTTSNEDEYYRMLYEDGYIPTNACGRGSSSSRRGREHVLQWEDYFMALSLLVAQRSEDPVTKVGAVIVRGMTCAEGVRFKITGIGYNHMPAGVRGAEVQQLWKQKDIAKDGWINTKYPYVCYAATNAILSQNAEDLRGCTLFTTLFPSHVDTKLLIQAGITEVVYCEDRQTASSHGTQKMLEKTGIKYTQWEKYREICTDLRVKECEKQAAEHRKKKTASEEKLAQEWEQFAKVERERKQPAIPLYPKLRKDPEVHGDHEATCTHLTDDDYYMGVACLSAERSKDPVTTVGACIVNPDGEVVGIGYNGWPYGISDDDVDIPWDKHEKDPAQKKHTYVVHAEANAIMHKTCISLKGCRIYTTLFPCNECAKLIIQSGITEVYYLRKPKQESGKPEKLWVQASRRLLSLAGYDLEEEQSPGHLGNPTDQLPSMGSQPSKKCRQYQPKRQIQIRWPPTTTTNSSKRQLSETYEQQTKRPRRT